MSISSVSLSHANQDGCDDILKGTCKYTPDEKYFVCKPKNKPKREKR